MHTSVKSCNESALVLFESSTIPHIQLIAPMQRIQVISHTVYTVLSIGSYLQVVRSIISVAQLSTK